MLVWCGSGRVRGSGWAGSGPVSGDPVSRGVGSVGVDSGIHLSFHA